MCGHLNSDSIDICNEKIYFISFRRNFTRAWYSLTSMLSTRALNVSKAFIKLPVQHDRKHSIHSSNLIRALSQLYYIFLLQKPVHNTLCAHILNELLNGSVIEGPVVSIGKKVFSWFLLCSHFVSFQSQKSQKEKQFSIEMKFSSDNNFSDLNSSKMWLWNDMYEWAQLLCEFNVRQYFDIFFVLFLSLVYTMALLFSAPQKEYKNYLWRNQNFAICSSRLLLNFKLIRSGLYLDFRRCCLSTSWLLLRLEFNASNDNSFVAVAVTKPKLDNKCFCHSLKKIFLLHLCSVGFHLNSNWNWSDCHLVHWMCPINILR